MLNDLLQTALDRPVRARYVAYTALVGAVLTIGGVGVGSAFNAAPLSTPPGVMTTHTVTVVRTVAPSAPYRNKDACNLATDQLHQLEAVQADLSGLVAKSSIVIDNSGAELGAGDKTASEAWLTKLVPLKASIEEDSSQLVSIMAQLNSNQTLCYVKGKK